MNVWLTDSPEIESVPVIVIGVVEPISTESDELMVNAFPDKLSQGCEVSDHVIFVIVPKGFVMTVGRGRVREFPI